MECLAPATGKSGEAPAVDGRHPGSEIDSDPCYSEDWVLGIVDLLLGRCSDCGLGSLASSFCKGREATMVEGDRVRASIFPLPLPSKQDFAQSIEKRDRRRVWFFLVLVALNYLNGGVHSCLASFEPSEVQSGILSYLEERVDTFLEHNFSLERFDWSNFLRTRTVSYANEEVRAAKWTSWSNVKPALPYGSVASLPAVDLAEDGVLDLLLHPLRYLKPNWSQNSVRASRVMVHDHEWGDLARGLVQYNLCAVLPRSALASPGGCPLMNGLFGVEKVSPDGVEVHRLIIMNLIPLNSLSISVAGDVATLPVLHQMSSIQLHPHEDLVVSSEDARCFFYLFRLPTPWLPLLAFGKEVPKDLIPPGIEEDCFLCAKVLPMGYLNSVGVAQHLHRNFLKRVQGPVQQLGAFNEVRKDRAWPLSNPVWRVYLDNLDVLEKVDANMIKVLEGKVSPDVAPLIAAYERAGIPLNAKKSCRQKIQAEVQGADIDGDQGWCRPKSEKLSKYVSAVVSLLRRSRCSQKEIQVVRGGLVYFAVFRRPLMSCLNFIWEFIQSFEKPGPRIRDIPHAVMSELLMFVFLLPLAHIDLRVPTSDLVTASDASTLGGGVCAAEGVTKFGEQVSCGPVRGGNLLTRELCALDSLMALVPFGSHWRLSRPPCVFMYPLIQTPMPIELSNQTFPM